MLTDFKIEGITDPATLACIARARSFKQYCEMVVNALADKCIFCNINPTVNRVLVSDETWLAWQNPYPEKYTRHHFVIVPRRHITDSSQLFDNEFLALRKIVALLKEQHGFKSNGFLIRDGDATLSAGTIQHLHAHVMVPDGTGRVEVPFYKGVKAEEEGFARAVVFEKMRLGAKSEDLSDQEMKLVFERI